MLVALGTEAAAVGAAFALRPNRADRQANGNSYGNLTKPMDRYDPSAGGAGYEHHNRQCNAGIPIRAALDSQGRAESSDHEDSYAECENVTRKISANQRSGSRT